MLYTKLKIKQHKPFLQKMAVFVQDIPADQIPKSVWNYILKRGNITVAFGNDISKIKQIAPLIAHAKKCLLSNNFCADDTYGLVELHSYNVKGQKNPIFGEHIDDYGGITCKVNTIIYYIRKDPGIVGGNLRVGNKIYDCSPPPEMIRTICMPGNIYHEVIPMSGKGIRKCVVVQLRCEQRYLFSPK